MATSEEEEEERLKDELRHKRICRCCLTQDGVMSDTIHHGNEDNCEQKKVVLKFTISTGGHIDQISHAPESKKSKLMLQMAECLGIEVNGEDIMPTTICSNCQQQLDRFYRFKQMCKKADTLLKTFLITGVYPKQLRVPLDVGTTATKRTKPVPTAPVVQHHSSSSQLRTTPTTPVPTAPVVQHPSSSSQLRTTPNTTYTSTAAPSLFAYQSSSPFVPVGTAPKQYSTMEYTVDPDADVLYTSDQIVELQNYSLASVLHTNTPSVTNTSTPALSAGQTGPPLESVGKTPKCRILENIPISGPDLHRSSKFTTSTPSTSTISTLAPRLSTVQTVRRITTAPEKTAPEHPALISKKRSITAAMKIFKCPDCDRKYVSEFNLYQHQTKTSHCTSCRKPFKSSHELVEHQKTHSDPRKKIRTSSESLRPVQSDAAVEKKEASDDMCADWLLQLAEGISTEDSAAKGSFEEQWQPGVSMTMGSNEGEKTAEHPPAASESTKGSIRIPENSTIRNPLIPLDMNRTLDPALEEMVIDGKIRRVKKVIMTKANILAMKKKGEVVSTGGKIVLKSLFNPASR